NVITASGNQISEDVQSIIFDSPLANVTVNGGSGTNQISVANLTVPIQSLTLDGGPGTNMFTFVNVGASVGALALQWPAGSANHIQVQGSLPPSVMLQNAPALVMAGADVSVDEGSTFTSAGSFIDSDAIDTATVDYGDGTGPQPLSLNSDGTFTLSHFYADNGTFTVTVQVNNSLTGAGTGSFVATVGNVAPAAASAGPGDGVPGQPRTFTF